MKNNWREFSFILIGLVVVVTAVFSMPRLKFVKEFDEFSLVDDETLNQIQEFNALFDSVEETSVLILEKSSLWDSNTDYEHLNEIVLELEQTIPDYSFHSIANIEILNKRGIGFEQIKILHKDNSSDIKELKSKYQDIFSKFESENGKFALIFIQSKSETNLNEVVLFEKLETIAPDIKVHFFNHDGFIKELNSLSYTNLIGNTTIVFGLLLFGFYFFTRSLKPILLIGFVLIINLAFLVIYAVLLEVQISPQLTSLPALIVILTFSDCIHITWAQQNYKKIMRKQMLLPLSLTSLTNCIGFLFFLSVSENEILFDLSLLAVFSIITSLLVSVYILFQFNYNQWGYQVDRLAKISNFLSKLINYCRGKYALSILTFLLVVGSVFIFDHIYIERNFKSKSEQQFSKASDILQNHFFGLHQFTLEISLKKGHKFTDIAVANQMDLVEKDLDSLFDFLYVSSPNEVIKRCNRFYHHNSNGSFELPKKSNYSKLQEFHLIKNRAGWKEVVNDNRNIGKITIGHNLSDLTKRNNCYQEFEKGLSNYSFLNLRLVSLSYLQDKEELNFLNYVFVGFLILLFVSSVMISLLKKSVLIAVKFLIANTIPLCFSLALMIVFNVPLNSNSFLMLSILIGVSLDDSIYYIYKNRLTKMKNSIQTPIILTSISLSLGMLGFLWSSYSWIQPFSVILALSFLLSLLLDMLLLDKKN